MLISPRNPPRPPGPETHCQPVPGFPTSVRLTPPNHHAPELPDTLLTHHSFRRESGSVDVVFCLCRCPAETLEGQRSRFLSADEEETWAGYEFPARRRSHLLGRYCAKQAVAALSGLPLPAIAITNGVFQQPLVRGPGTHGLHVSVSHSGGAGAAVAFPEAHPMGIDLEQIRPARQVAIETQLTPAELDLVRSAPFPAVEAATLLWTAKEALSKALRTGMMTPFKLFEIARPVWREDGLATEFTSFAQYRAELFRLDGWALGVAIPKHSQSIDPLRFRWETSADSANTPNRRPAA